MDTITVQKLEYILSGCNVSQEEKNELIDLMENYAKEQCNIGAVVGRSEQLPCGHKQVEIVGHAAKCKDCGTVFETK